MFFSSLKDAVASRFGGESGAARGSEMLAAQIDRWDAREISGCVSSGTPRRLVVELSGQQLALLDSDAGMVEFGDGRFRINTEYFPAACLGDIRLLIEGDDHMIALTRSGQTTANRKSTHSLYGGMWIDAPDWHTRLAEKTAAGAISEEIADQIVTFVRDGYIVIPSAVSLDTVDRLNQQIEDAWDGKMPGVMLEIFNPQAIVGVDRQYYNQNTKLLDAYFHMEAAREVAAAPKVVDFMTAVFEDKPKAFQQLSFIWGSTQPIHKDTAYVKVDGNPMSMLATWTALEDISEGTGELEYFVGSHRSEDYIFGSLSKWMEAAPHQHADFLTSLHDDAKRFGQTRASFLAKPGDVLIWHADLAHGGSQITQPGVTRKSIVTHYTAAKYSPFYHRYSTNPPTEYQGMVFVCEKGPITI